MEYTEILINIRKIVRSINLESKRIEKEYGISIPQLLCLNFLNDQEDYRATSTDIKKFLNLNASTVTGIISRLEVKNLVARLPNRKDKRMSFITITSKGVECVNNVPPLMHEKLSAKLQSLPGNKLDELKDAILLLLEYMDISEVDAAPLIAPELSERQSSKGGK
jgi:DNA-binding MarR family transcriptional regulator